MKTDLPAELQRPVGGRFHRYRSTACLHEQHGECRKTCKFCKTMCVCSCHDLDPIDA